MDRLFNDFYLWRQDFMAKFFDLDYVFSLVVILGIGYTTYLFLKDINILHPVDDAYEWENFGNWQTTLHETRGQMVGRVLNIGIIIVITAVLVNVDFKNALPTYQVSLSLAPHIINILVYF